MACTAMADCLDSSILQVDDVRMSVVFEGDLKVSPTSYSNDEEKISNHEAMDSSLGLSLIEHRNCEILMNESNNIMEGYVSDSLIAELCKSRPPSSTSPNSSDMSTIGPDDELMNSKLIDMEGKDKYDVQTSNNMIEIWKLFSQQSSHHRNISSLLARLIRVTAQVILSASWTKVSEEGKAHFEEYLLTSATSMENEDEPLWSKLCQNIVLMLKCNLWQLPHLQNVYEDKRLTVETVNSLWDAEGCVFLEIRLEKLCQARAYDNAILIAEACVLKGHNLYEKNQNIEDGLSPFYMSSDKYYQFAAIFTLVLHRQEVEDDADRYFPIKKYLTPSFCLETANRLTSSENLNRIAPKWKKGWKYGDEAALQFLEIALLETITKQINLQELSNIFSMWLRLYLQYNITEHEEFQDQSNTIHSSSDLGKEFLQFRIPTEEIENMVKVALKNDYIYVLADCIITELGLGPVPRSKCLELYVPALIRDINKLEGLKANEFNKDEVMAFGQKLSFHYQKLANYFQEDGQTKFELLLTCFSLNPSQELFINLNNIAEGNEGDISMSGSNSEEGRTRVNVCEKISASKKASDLKITPLLYEGLLTIMTNPRWTRLNCFRQSWEEFKPLCLKHLETKGEDIKGVKDLELVTPDYSKYEDLKPAYDDSDNGYEPGYGPSEFDVELQEEEEEGKVPKKIREPSHRLMNLDKLNQSLHNRIENVVKNNYTYKNKLKRLMKVKANPTKITSNKKLVLKENRHQRLKVDRSIIKHENSGLYLSWRTKGRPPKTGELNHRNKSERSRKDSADLIKRRGRPKTMRKVHTTLPYPLPISDDRNSKMIPYVPSLFPPPTNSRIFLPSSERGIPDNVCDWMFCVPSDDSSTTFCFCQSHGSVNFKNELQELEEHFSKKRMTSYMITEKRNPKSKNQVTQGVYFNKNFSSDSKDWDHWCKFANWNIINTDTDSKQPNLQSDLSELTPVPLVNKLSPTLHSGFLSPTRNLRRAGLMNKVIDTSNKSVLNSKKTVLKLATFDNEEQPIESAIGIMQNDVKQIAEATECLNLPIPISTAAIDTGQEGFDQCHLPFMNQDDIMYSSSLLSTSRHDFLRATTACGIVQNECINQATQIEIAQSLNEANDITSEVFPVLRDILAKVSTLEEGTEVTGNIHSHHSSDKVLEELSVALLSDNFKSQELVSCSENSKVQAAAPEITSSVPFANGLEVHSVKLCTELLEVAGTVPAFKFREELPLPLTSFSTFDMPPSENPSSISYEDLCEVATPLVHKAITESSSKLVGTVKSAKVTEPILISEDCKSSSIIGFDHTAGTASLTSCRNVLESAIPGDSKILEICPHVLRKDEEFQNTPDLIGVIKDKNSFVPSDGAAEVIAILNLNVDTLHSDSESKFRIASADSDILKVECDENNFLVNKIILTDGAVNYINPTTELRVDTTSSCLESIKQLDSTVNSEALKISEHDLNNLVTILSETSGELIKVPKFCEEIINISVNPAEADLCEENVSHTSSPCLAGSGELNKEENSRNKQWKIECKKLAVTLERLTDQEIIKWRRSMVAAMESSLPFKVTRKRKRKQPEHFKKDSIITRNSLKNIDMKIEDFEIIDKRRIPLQLSVKNGHVKPEVEQNYVICNQILPSPIEFQIPNSQSELIPQSNPPHIRIVTSKSRKRSLTIDSTQKNVLPCSKRRRVTNVTKINSSKFNKLVKIEPKSKRNIGNLECEPMESEEDSSQSSSDDPDFVISESELEDNRSCSDIEQGEVVQDIKKDIRSGIKSEVVAWKANGLFNLNLVNISPVRENCTTSSLTAPDCRDPLAIEPSDIEAEILEPLIVDLVSDSEIDSPTKESSIQYEPCKKRRRITTQIFEQPCQNGENRPGRSSCVRTLNFYSGETKNTGTNAPNSLQQSEIKKETHSGSSVSKSTLSSNNFASDSCNPVNLELKKAGAMMHSNQEAGIFTAADEDDSEPFDSKEDPASQTHSESDSEVDPLPADHYDLEIEPVDPDEICRDGEYSEPEIICPDEDECHRNGEIEEPDLIDVKTESLEDCRDELHFSKVSDGIGINIEVDNFDPAENLKTFNEPDLQKRYMFKDSSMACFSDNLETSSCTVITSREKNEALRLKIHLGKGEPPAQEIEFCQRTPTPSLKRKSSSGQIEFSHSCKTLLDKESFIERLEQAPHDEIHLFLPEIKPSPDNQEPFPQENESSLSKVEPSLQTVEQLLEKVEPSPQQVEFVQQRLKHSVPDGSKSIKSSSQQPFLQKSKFLSLEIEPSRHEFDSTTPETERSEELESIPQEAEHSKEIESIPRETELSKEFESTSQETEPSQEIEPKNIDLWPQGVDSAIHQIEVRPQLVKSCSEESEPSQNLVELNSHEMEFSLQRVELFPNEIELNSHVITFSSKVVEQILHEIEPCPNETKVSPHKIDFAKMEVCPFEDETSPQMDKSGDQSQSECKTSMIKYLQELEIVRKTNWSKDNNFGSRRTRIRKRRKGKLYTLVKEYFVDEKGSLPLLTVSNQNSSDVTEVWRDEPPLLDCYEPFE